MTTTYFQKSGKINTDTTIKLALQQRTADREPLNITHEKS
jgi:hypothetical protein